eukprot:Lithocolla_globosa_v1_NODE_286_length_4646_cov_126.764975.p5 type:complete len:150 gc:universal NODE_286_length_4646_cov_126.764975:1835-1386(-)
MIFFNDGLKRMNNEVETYSTVIISGTIPANESEFKYEIYIPHDVDEMVIKTLSFTNFDVTEDPAPDPPIQLITTSDMILLRSDLNGNDPLISFPSITMIQETFNNPYKINRSVRGTYVFQLRDIDGFPWSSTKESSLCITVCFIKWRRK